MPAAQWPGRVVVREVGPRDGLQVERAVPVDQRVALVEALLAAGVREIEVGSFVSPRAVPAMAGTAEVVAALGRRRDVRCWALVPNRRGAELALAAGLGALTVTVSVSSEYNRRNVNMTVEQSLSEVEGIARLAGPEAAVDAVVSCAFGSPYEGDVAPRAVGDLAARLLEGGATTLTLADTTGMATPRRVEEVVAAVAALDVGPAGPGAGGAPGLGLHLHDTRGTALVNAYAALGLGVTRFDTSVGGLGGSPAAPTVGGNLATEDLVHLLDDLGVETGISLDAVLDAGRLAAGLVGHPVPSRVAAAGPRAVRAGRVV